MPSVEFERANPAIKWLQKHALDARPLGSSESTRYSLVEDLVTNKTSGEQFQIGHTDNRRNSVPAQCQYGRVPELSYFSSVNYLFTHLSLHHFIHQLAHHPFFQYILSITQTRAHTSTEGRTRYFLNTIQKY